MLAKKFGKIKILHQNQEKTDTKEVAQKRKTGDGEKKLGVYFLWVNISKTHLKDAHNNCPGPKYIHTITTGWAQIMRWWSRSLISEGAISDGFLNKMRSFPLLAQTSAPQGMWKPCQWLTSHLRPAQDSQTSMQRQEIPSEQRITPGGERSAKLTVSLSRFSCWHFNLWFTAILTH